MLTVRSALHRKMGEAPGANGVYAALPSGRAPVALPYTTLDVIVRIDVVGSEFLYVWFFLIFSMKVFRSHTANSSALGIIITVFREFAF